MSACRRAFRVRMLLVALFAALLSVASPVSAQPKRPFLIVREDMYGEFRGRVAREPWAGAVEGACGSLGIHASGPCDGKGRELLRDGDSALSLL